MRLAGVIQRVCTVLSSYECRGLLPGQFMHGLRRIYLRKYHWGNLGVDGWIILEWIPRRWHVGVWTGLGRPRIETSGGRL